MQKISSTVAPYPDLKPAASWSYKEFETLMHEGKRPDGTQLNEMMPWKAFAHYSITEIKALYAHLKTIQQD